MWTEVVDSFGSISTCVIAGLYGKVMLSKKLPNSLLKWLCHGAVPLAVKENTCRSLCLLGLGMGHALASGHLVGPCGNTSSPPFACL